MRLSRTVICCSLVLSLFASRWAHADPIDPAGARELLKQGYALKQDGKYDEALQRLVESLRLDPQTKTLLNIADCEESLGMLSQAQKHWVMARDQATAQGAQMFLAEADKRLAALDARMPRLTVNRVGPGVEGLSIRRDGVLLEGASLGIPLPTDPGKHEVVVTAPGYAEGRYSIELVEKDSKVLDVAVGAASATPGVVGAEPPKDQKPPDAQQPPNLPEQRSPSENQKPKARDDAARSAPYWNTQRLIGVGAAGLGVVGFGLAGYSWSRANSQHHEALSYCTPNCDSTANQKQSDAISSAHLSSAMLITGSVLVAGGAVLWIAAPSSAHTTVGLAPIAGASEAGLVAAGIF